MLYLEDFLELIEVFPDIVKERLSEMRVIDLEVENAFDRLKDAESDFFKKCALMDPETRQREYREAISKVYDQCVEKIDEKIHSSSQLLDMVERYMYKQETEVSKFKLELEADNGGVTEILERQVAEEADKQQQMLRHQRIEKKRHHNRAIGQHQQQRGDVGGTSNGRLEQNGDLPSSSSSSHLPKRLKSQHYPLQLPPPAAADMLPPLQLSGGGSGSQQQPIVTLDRVDAAGAAAVRPAASLHNHTQQQQQQLYPHALHNGGVPGGGSSNGLVNDVAAVGGSHMLGEPHAGGSSGTSPAAAAAAAAAALHQMGAGNTAIAAAASQAIQATQQMQQGRRTASLKASYAAVAKGTAAALGLQQFLTGGGGSAVGGSASGTAPPGILATSTSSSGRAIKPTPQAAAAALAATAANKGKKLGTLSKSASSAVLSTLAGGASGVGGRKVSAAGAAGSGSAGGVGLHTSRSVAANLSGLTRVGVGAGKGPIVGGGLERGGLHFKSDLAAGASSEEGEPPEFISDDGYSDQADNQLYCKCRQVSYGDMIACDNPDCPIEWFHYPCVNLVSAPKGKWFCPDCIVSMRRRGGMKKM